MRSSSGVIGAVDPGGCRRALDDVLADERRLEALLPSSLLAVPERELRASARRVLVARGAVARRRARLGDKPHFDAGAERAVMAARADAEATRAGLRQAGDASHRLLAAGNLAGLAMIGASVAAVVAGMSPLATPVAVGIMAAGGGPIGGLVGGWRGRVAAQRAHADAVAAWSEALRRADAETMGDLAAARARFDTWRRHHQELEVALDEEAEANQAWVALAGDHIDPASIGALCAVLRQLRSVKLERLQHALADRLSSQAPAAPAIDLRAEPADERPVAAASPVAVFARPRGGGGGSGDGPRSRRARRRSANHPAIAGVALRDARDGHVEPIVPSIAAATADRASEDDSSAGPESAAGLAPGDGGSLVLDLLERVRDKGLHLWSST